MNNERQPLYVQIQNHFKRLIGEGELRTGDKIPTEQELMAAFNVSRITVANALSQLAKEGWIHRIPGKGSYVGRDLSGSANTVQSETVQSETVQHEKTGNDEQPVPPPSQRTEAVAASGKMIGFVVPSINDFFALRLIRGINSVLGGTPYYLNIVLTNESEEREREAISELLRMGAVGLIIFPIDATTYNEEILALKVNRFPFVLIDRYLRGVETHFVCSDSSQGAELAVSHLWELGHRDIAVCSDSPLQTVTVQDRIAGYMDALKRRGALINPALLLTDFTLNAQDVEDGAHMIHRYIGSRLATAYITLNSTLGTRLAAVAEFLNMSVPGDLSIVTFDDPSPGLDNRARFTHIAQSEEEIGRQATRILLDALSENFNDYRQIVLEPRLIAGRTTGPLAEKETRL